MCGLVDIANILTGVALKATSKLFLKGVNCLCLCTSLQSEVIISVQRQIYSLQGLNLMCGFTNVGSIEGQIQREAESALYS